MVRSIFASVVVFTALFAHRASGRDIELLDFTSPNCGPCQQMAPTIKSMIDAGFPITRIDVTRDPQTAARYNVPRVPTLIMLVDGQVFDRSEGGTSGQNIESMFQRARAELEHRKQERIRMQSPDRLPTSQSAQQTSETAPPSVAWPGGQRLPETFANGADPPRLTQARADAPRPGTLDVRPSSFDATASADPRSARLLNASVRIRVDDEKGHSFGTGTIIDARQGEALVITCGHLFRETKGQGPLSVEMFETTPGGVRSIGQVAGQVISYDLARDVALVAIRPGRSVAVAPIALPRTTIQRGDRVVNIGCSNGQDPTALASRITALDRYQGAPNIEASGAPVEGRSGGGLFNQDGQLIGICFAADREGNEGLYASLKAIHDELNARGLSDIYLSRDAVGANSDMAANIRPGAGGPIIRGQDPGITPLPATNRDLPRPASDTPAKQATLAISPTPSAAPAGLNATEQAAWEEIMRRAATSEVICIIRPKQPGGQSEVITLDNVSADFVRGLASRSQPGGPVTR